MAKPRAPRKNASAVNENVTPAPENGSTLTTASGNGEALVSETRKAPKKPEIIKSDSRANLVPINIEEEIRRLAYLYSERRGFEPGHETEDWLAAENEVRQRYRQQSA